MTDVAEHTCERLEDSSPVIDVCPPTCQSPAEEVAVMVKNSGISSMVSLPARDAADELRRWLKEHRCRVGPVFGPSGDPVQYCFFVYTRRRGIGEIASTNRKFRFRLAGDARPANDRVFQTNEGGRGRTA